MARDYSLAYLTAHRCSPAEAVRIAADTGYGWVGLRPWPVAPGAAFQDFLNNPAALRETLAAMRDTGVRVFDLEIIRIGENFDPHAWDAQLDSAAALGAQAILVAGDDKDEDRLSANYAMLCEALAPYGLSGNLEFMPWTAVPDAAAALRIMRGAGGPRNAGILVDALHFGRSHTTLEDIQAIPREWLQCLQLSDAAAGVHFSHEEMVQTARCERLLPGEGNIDLQGLLASVPSELPVSIEVVNLARQAAVSPRDWAAQCLAASRQYCDQPRAASALQGIHTSSVF